MYLQPAVELLSRFQSRIHDAADPEDQDELKAAMKIDIISVITIISALLPLIQSMCKKPAPPAPPVPTALTLVGVSNETWQQASDSKWAANEAYNVKTDTFSKSAIRAMARKIATRDNIRTKAARPAAIAALQTARDEQTEAIALTIHGTKNTIA